MATILRSAQREFEENPNRIDGFRILSDMNRAKKGIRPQNLDFDLRRLDPGQSSAPYHFHRYAEELFMIVSGSATLRSSGGVDVVASGDLIFFGMGSQGAHQLYNHTDEACVYLDVRSFIGYDVCEYPDSNKILLVPSFEIFARDAQPEYFAGEEPPRQGWKRLERIGE